MACNSVGQRLLDNPQAPRSQRNAPTQHRAENSAPQVENAVSCAVKWTAMNPGPSDRLEQQMAELCSRVHKLEQALHSYGIVLEPEVQSSAEPAVAEPMVAALSTPTPAIDYRGVPHASPEVAPVERPLFASSSGASPADERSLESRIGSQWFNRVGILAVLIAMAWFLKLAVDNHWIGPLGRVVLGLVAGAGLIVWSEHFRASGYLVFSYSLKAVGSGVLYLSLWAAFSLFHLIPAPVAFAAMILVTAFNGFMSWVQDAELLALYGIGGGLSTPLLVSTGGNHEITLFTYLLLLDIAVLVLVALRPWSRLLFSAFVGSVLFVTGWWFEYYTDAQLLRTALFLGCFFLIFALAPRLVRLNSTDDAHFSGWDTLALVLMPIANAALGFLAFYGMADAHQAAWIEPWMAVGFAAFYMMLLRLPARGSLRASPELLSALHLTAAVVFLTIAIPLKAEGRWLTIGWLVEGAALLWAASRVRNLLLRVLALLCLAIGLVALLVVNPAASTMPFINERFETYCVAIAVFAFAAWVSLNSRGEADPESSIPWTVLAPVTALIVNALVLLAICWEIDGFWWHVSWRGDMNLLDGYRMYAQFTYSAFFMAYGALLLAGGFWRQSAFLRWQALVLLAVSIGKVFLYDVSELSQGFRILSFLGLGALLLAVSFVYQRDWLHLRGQNHTDNQEHQNGRTS